MATNSGPIAIVGIAAELPSGTLDAKNLDHASFFKFLLNRGESYEVIPSDRLNVDKIRGRTLGQVLPTHGSFLKNLDQFDYLEFGVTAKDARAMAVSTRKLLELSFLSLLDSGIDYRSQNVGCYMAGISHDIFMTSGQDEMEARGSFGCLPAMIANRVSYHLDLRGPSVPVDTACSSSLTATHLAIQALRARECEAAVVGGAQINVRFAEWFNYTQGGVLSPDGKCKPFDASADGFSRGEGAVVIVLKPLEAALRDGDYVYASILGTGINSAGSLAPINAPVATAQEEAMQRAFKQAGRRPQEADFVELHATGTSRGDPTEANWVGSAFKRKDELLIGSVKGNIGHLEIAAFLASLSKVCSIFETGVIPPNVNLENPNPAIHWEEYGLRVPGEGTPLPCRASSGRSLVAMTSSGIGGANGHCVVEAPPQLRPCSSTFWRDGFVERPSLLPVGGLSPRSTAAIIDSIGELARAGIPHELPAALGRQVRSMTWRSYGITSSHDGKPRFVEPTLASKQRQPLVFVFSGQGPQHFQMGRELFHASRVFHDAVLAMDAIFEHVAGESLIRDYGLFADDSVSKPLGDPWPIAITLPSLTIVQIALFDTLISLGVKPDAVVGHSAGETSVLYACGAASRELAVELSIARGRGMTPLESLGGTMAAVNCTSLEAERIIAAVKAELGDGYLEIGCYNAVDAVTLSGQTTHIDIAVKKATSMGIFARKLRTRVPVHSTMMDLCADEYRQLVGDVFARHTLQTPTIAAYSTASGGLMTDPMDADYFWNNTRGPVQFTQAITGITDALGACAYLELSPHPVLASYLSSLAAKSSTIVCPMRRPSVKNNETAVEVSGLLTSLGQLIASGQNSLDLSILYGRSPKASRSLPPYPLALKHVPYLISSEETTRFLEPRNGPLNHQHLRVNSATHPSLAQHVINGEPIMPASGYLEMALEFGARRIWNAKFVTIIGLSSENPVPVNVSLNGNHWTVKSSAIKIHQTDKLDRLHAEGYLSLGALGQNVAYHAIDLTAIRRRCSAVSVKGFYEGMTHFAQYGPEYQRITAILKGNNEGKDEGLVEIRGLTGDLHDSPDYILHPAILDAAIHAVVHPLFTGVRDTTLYYLPAAVNSVIVHDALHDRSCPEALYTHVIMQQWTPASIIYDCFLVDTHGVRLCTLEGLEIARHEQASLLAPIMRYDLEHIQTSLSVKTRPNHRSISPADSGYGGSERASDGPEASAEVILYRRGYEMEIQNVLSKSDSFASRIVWFTSAAGGDGDALVGFARSIRREYPAWTVRSVVFEQSWTYTDYRAVISELASLDDLEDEVIINDQGALLAPRITVAEGHSAITAFDPSKPWIMLKGELKQTCRPEIEDGDLLVQVLSVSIPSGGIRGFVGQECKRGTLVAGITDQALANFLSVKPDSLAELSARQAGSTHQPPVLSAVIVALALGLSEFCELRHLRGSLVAVTQADSRIGCSITSILTTLGLRVCGVPENASAFDLGMLSQMKPRVVISGHPDTATLTLLADSLGPQIKLFAWNDPKHGLVPILRSQPWLIGDALRLAFNSKVAEVSEPMSSMPDILAELNASDVLVQSSEHLFNSSKAYVLLGGIGSLGFQIALWMYENGARYIVMTSRTGRESIFSRKDYTSQRILGYLESLPNLDLTLVAVDIASVVEMTCLFDGIRLPVGGCMLLSAVLIDRPFASLDEASFEAAYKPKVDGFRALEESISISSLDWLIAFTSVSGLFGSAGQTNYASANTAVDGLTRKYENAFSLVAPVITDSTIASSSQAAQLKHLTSWGFTSRELCSCIGDGILKLRNGPYWLYIPNFDWNEVEKRLGPSTAFRHLVTAEDNPVAPDSASQSLDALIRKVLDVAEEDLLPDVPLTSYGLDSLSAGRLSAMLRPILPITQMQLLADMSVNDIRLKIDEAQESNKTESKSQPSVTLRITDFDWATFHRPGQTVVKIVEDTTDVLNPLILLHGTGGNGVIFQPMLELFSSPLWFLQTTPEAPMDSVPSLTEFYYRQIKSARPAGPYRLGVFCATSPIGYELVHTFERHGDQVEQFVLLDHFPALYCTPHQALDVETIESGAMSETYYRRAFDLLLKMYQDDWSPARQRMIDDLRAASRGESVRPYVQTYYEQFKSIMNLLIRYCLELVPQDVRHHPEAFSEAMQAALQERMRTIRAPVTVYGARKGMIAGCGVSWKWSDFGVSDEAVVEIEGGHFEMFQQQALADSIQARMTPY